jgi:predicted RecA/RadA family phage recombinase
MAHKYLESGEYFEGIAAAALVTGDVVFDRDGRPGVITAMTGVAAGQRFKAQTTGVYEMPALPAGVWAAGAVLYYDAANRRLTNVPNGRPIGRADAAKVDQATTAVVRMDPTVSLTGVGNVKHIRARVSAADVNAGVVLVPAHPHKSFRVVDMSLISEGGAAGGANSVDIRGTQGTTGVNLLAAAVAGLTQNTLLRAGAANAAILAAGASFAPCDVNTGLTLARTGSNLTGSTHIHVLLSYAEDAA